MARPFHWFGPESVAQLKAELDAGLVARLEVHQDGTDMTLHVVHEGDLVVEGGGGGINESHVCPPSCP